MLINESEPQTFSLGFERQTFADLAPVLSTAVATHRAPPPLFLAGSLVKAGCVPRVHVFLRFFSLHIGTYS